MDLGRFPQLSAKAILPSRAKPRRDEDDDRAKCQANPVHILPLCLPNFPALPSTGSLYESPKQNSDIVVSADTCSPPITRGKVLSCRRGQKWNLRQA